MGAIVFVGVEGFIVYSVFRYRRRDDRLPTQIHGNNLVELIWTADPDRDRAHPLRPLDPHPQLDLQGSYPRGHDRGRGQAVVVGLPLPRRRRRSRRTTSSSQGTALNGRVMALPVGEPVQAQADLQRRDPLVLRARLPREARRRARCRRRRQPNELDLHGQRGRDLQRAVRRVLRRPPRADDLQRAGHVARRLRRLDRRPSAPGESPPPSVRSAAGRSGAQAQRRATSPSTPMRSRRRPDQPFKIEFTNDDDVDHNVGIWTDEDEELFRGDDLRRARQHGDLRRRAASPRASTPSSATSIRAGHDRHADGQVAREASEDRWQPRP